jgi:NADPH-dependent glutamate synthase beta subunit-like oxidoreductase
MTERPFAITLDVGSSRANHTGSWRSERPVYLDLLPPCNQACPAEENIQKWLYDAEDGSYERAWRTLMEANPLPAVLGRVCYHPCQTACNRGLVDEAVGINSIERFLGDLALEKGWQIPVTAKATGHRVLVVGAGPSGLSAAYQLRLLGHDVTIRDAGAEAGGMMRYGIPSYRLPRHVLNAEVQRIVALGVRLELGTPVTDVLAEKEADGFDAVFLAAGAQIGKRVDIPAADAARVLDALSVLRDVADDDPPMLGRQVVVYGGGNTALDAARTAKRLGATDAVVVYRRTREQMPANDGEVLEALAEGISLKWLSTIDRVDPHRLRIEQMTLDDTGFPQPTGVYEELAADCLILAVGQDVDHALLETVPGLELDDGSVRVGPDLMTGHAGVFAGGDLISSERTVTSGIGNGRAAARSVDAWLRNTVPLVVPAPRVAPFEGINAWYYSDAPHAVRPRLEAARRTDSFDEVVGGLDESSALYEARRCLSCGNCFECDNCYGVCPDNAVVKLGPGLRYAIDLDYCKGCGICVSECPCGAIDMQPERA